MALGRALDKLREGVERAIESLGTGFLAHRANARLKDALESGELDKQEYYRQILRLVYRLIFLFVAEERDALLDPNATEDWYGSPPEGLQDRTGLIYQRDRYYDGERGPVRRRCGRMGFVL